MRRFLNLTENRAIHKALGTSTESSPYQGHPTRKVVAGGEPTLTEKQRNKDTKNGYLQYTPNPNIPILKCIQNCPNHILVQQAIVVCQLGEVVCREGVARCGPVSCSILDSTSQHVPTYHAERIDVRFVVLRTQIFTTKKRGDRMAKCVQQAVTTNKHEEAHIYMCVCAIITILQVVIYLQINIYITI